MGDPNQDTTLINLCTIEIWLRSNQLACCPIRWRRLEVAERRRAETSSDLDATRGWLVVQTPVMIGCSRIQGWFDMSTFSDSYVSRVLFASSATGRGLDLAARRWRQLRSYLCDPYRPELHYMRGPGPKWRERHGRCGKL
jgi:hypothetical protein